MKFTNLFRAVGGFGLISHNFVNICDFQASYIESLNAHDIAEILLKVALNTKNQINQST
jgi:hypothetical protein